MKKNILFLLVLLVFLSSCRYGEQAGRKDFRDTVLVAWNDPHILAMGRINRQEPDHVILYWPGTYLKICFYGNRVEALLKDRDGKNYYDVVLDNDKPLLLHPDTAKRWYILADNLPGKEHVIELFKRTEWSNGSTFFYGFRVTGKAKLLDPPKTSGKMIEIFGNSISAGYADHDTVDDRPDSTLTDNYVSYGAITARHYNAGYYCTSKGGIGIMVSWFPLIMPEMYDRLDPADPASKWDFSKVQPDIVVINLGQNDSWLVNMPDYPEFKHRFGTSPPTERQIIDAYKDFVGKIRKVYPNAHIICALGSMDATKEGSPWPGYIKTAVKEMNDTAVFTFFFPYINKPGHPKVEDHKVMADTLIRFIDENINW